MTRSRHDVIVVGAGPAGSTAALRAAEAGMKVLLLERKPEVALPVRCAEGVSKHGLQTYFDPKPEWIAAEIDGVQMIAPNGRSVMISDGQKGYILRRDIFDADLANMAICAGADLLTGAYVNGLLLDGKQVTGVRFIKDDMEHEAWGSVVIGADGLESRLGRWAGIRTAFAMRDMESCAQAALDDIDINPRHIVMYFGRNVAPGGYAWIFPKGERSANVGLGIAGTDARNRSARAYLDDFLNGNFPKGRVSGRVVGGVPCDKTLKRITAGGFMLAGDAAHQVNPLTGGGIIRAIQAGSMAGTAAAQAIRSGDVSENGLEEYPRRWNDERGKLHAYYYRLKEAVHKLSDENFNHIADVMSRVPEHELTFYTIFKVALKNHPGLLTDLVKALAWSRN